MGSEITVRRARREDFERVRGLLRSQGEAARADRKRFRRLVSTLREDLYLAERGDERALVGLAVIVYVRGLGPATAVVERLVGDAAAATLLLDCAHARARARGCRRLELKLASGADAAAELAPTLLAAGWREAAHTLVQELGA
jgi:hypothetical protein